MTETHKIYQIARASGNSPLVFDSPHSGTIYPDDFGYACTKETLGHYEDHFVDLLFEDAALKNGAAFLKAFFPRTYIDPNRAEDDISEGLRPTDWPSPTSPSPRSEAGHGLIRETIGSVPVYDRPLMSAELARRIEHYYRPYHAALKELLDAAYRTNGEYFHINCHSCPAQALRPYYTGPLPDFVLGDRDGTSCGIAFRRSIQSFLIGLGYRVAVNIPYKGVEIVKRYGDPANGKHSLQIEINQDLYLSQNDGVIEKRFNKLKDDLEKLIHHISGYAAHSQIPQAAD